MSDIVINQLPADVQNYIRTHNLDVGNDGHINDNDVAALQEALQKDASPEAKALVQSLLNAVANPLQTPRSAATGVRLRTVLDTNKTPKPVDAIDGLDNNTFRGANVDERVGMLNHILNGTGTWMWTAHYLFGGGYNSNREREALDIITSTPDYQKPALAKALHDKGLDTQLRSRTTSTAQSQRLEAFQKAYVWAIGEAPAVSDAIIAQDLNNQAEFWGVVDQMRATRGDKFASDVLAQLWNKHALNRAMPFVFNRFPTLDSCTSESDLASVYSWRSNLESRRNNDAARFQSVLGHIPPGNFRDLLVNEFEGRHNVDAAMVGVTEQACRVQITNHRIAVAAAIAAAAARAAEEEDRQRREDAEDARRRAQDDYNRSRRAPTSGTGLDPTSSTRRSSGSGNGLDDAPSTRSTPRTTTPAPTPAPPATYNPVDRLDPNRTRSLGSGAGRNTGASNLGSEGAGTTTATKRTLGSGAGRTSTGLGTSSSTSSTPPPTRSLGTGGMGRKKP